jgi:hypothetical protein
MTAFGIWFIGGANTEVAVGQKLMNAAAAHDVQAGVPCVVHLPGHG